MRSQCRRTNDAKQLRRRLVRRTLQPVLDASRTVRFVKAAPNRRALLELLEADSIKDARRAVAALERDGYEWTPLGGKEGNFGLVNIGSDPGFAFVERITNALDAVIDEAARHAPAALIAAALFGIPEGRVAHCSAEAQSDLGAVTVRIGDGALSRTRRAHE